MSLAASRVLAQLTLLLSCAGCGERPPEADPSPAPTPGLARAAPSPTPVAARAGAGPSAPACFRGGSTPDEVRAVMGPPDSILFGWWIYGGSQVFFGYGTVQSYENAGNLILC